MTTKLSCAVLFSPPPQKKKPTIIDLIADGDDAIKVQISHLESTACFALVYRCRVHCTAVKGDRDLLQQGTKGGEVMMFS